MSISEAMLTSLENHISNTCVVTRRTHSILVYPPITNTVGVTILDWIESIPDVNILDSLEDNRIRDFLNILVDRYNNDDPDDDLCDDLYDDLDDDAETIEIVTPNIIQAKTQLDVYAKATWEKDMLLVYFPIIQLLHNVVNMKLESEIDIGASRSPDTVTILDWINEIPYRDLTSDIYDLNGDYLLEFLDLVKAKHSVKIENTEIRLPNLINIMDGKLCPIKPSLTPDTLKTLQFLYNKYSIKNKVVV